MCANKIYCFCFGRRIIFSISHFIFSKEFIYFQGEGKGGKKTGRETWMCERNIDQLSLACFSNCGPDLQPRHMP